MRIKFDDKVFVYRVAGVVSYGELGVEDIRPKFLKSALRNSQTN